MTMVDPAAALEAEAESVGRLRSGPIGTRADDGLFVSLVSLTTPSSSALANRKYAPAAVPAGIVTLVAPPLDAPAGRAGTDRLSVKRTSPASSVELADR